MSLANDKIKIVLVIKGRQLGYGLQLPAITHHATKETSLGAFINSTKPKEKGELFVEFIGKLEKTVQDFTDMQEAALHALHQLSESRLKAEDLRAVMLDLATPFAEPDKDPEEPLPYNLQPRYIKGQNRLRAKHCKYLRRPR